MRTSGFLLTLKTDNFDPEDDIVIYPQWLIDGFRQVIDFDEHLPSPIGPVRRIALGELTEEAAIEVWKDSRFQDKIEILLKFMEQLGLIAKPRNGSFYYIPSLLDCHSGEEEVNKWLSKEKRFVSKALVLDFRKEGKQVPFPHFDKMMSEFISRQTKRITYSCKKIHLYRLH